MAAELRRQVADLVAKGTVQRVPRHRLRCASPLFLVPKKGGKWRLVHDLRVVNDSIVYRRFRLAGLQQVRQRLRRGAWMASVDLTDAYYHIPLHPAEAPLGFTPGSFAVPVLRTGRQPAESGCLLTPSPAQQPAGCCELWVGREVARRRPVSRLGLLLKFPHRLQALPCHHPPTQPDPTPRPSRGGGCRRLRAALTGGRPVRISAPAAPGFLAWRTG